MANFGALQTDLIRFIIFIFEHLRNLKCKVLILLINYDVFTMLIAYKLFMPNGYRCISFFDASYAPLDIVQICMIISRLGYLKHINILNLLYQIVQCGLNMSFIMSFNFYKNILPILLFLKVVSFVRYGYASYSLYQCGLRFPDELDKIMVWDDRSCLWKYPLNFNCTIEANTYMVGRREEFFCSSPTYDVNYIILMNAMVIHATSIALFVIYFLLLMGRGARHITKTCRGAGGNLVL